MSSMLEQAIVDAKALREAALKNAEQAIVEKYAPEIKEAVNSLLEGKELLKEEEESAGSPDTGFRAPPAFNPLDSGEPVRYHSKMDEPIYEFNLLDFEPQEESAEDESEMDSAGSENAAPQVPPQAPIEEPAGGGMEGLGGLGSLQESVEANKEEVNEDDIMEQIMSILSETDDEDEEEVLEEDEEEEKEEVLEEELIVDTSAQKNGTFESNEATLQYMQELELAQMESTEYKEKNEELSKRLEQLDESYLKLSKKNKQYKEIVEKINEKLNETLLSNAKLLYSNKTLSDASLNERQKSKIVEAIAKAKTPEEAKNLCEALNATVTSGNDKRKTPRTLSESVQRRSNLSSILPRRNKPADSEQHTFADHMKKLAGIK